MKVPMMATTPAMSGEASAGTSTLPTTAELFTAEVPPVTQAAPIRPPISAWVELEGSPKYQVTRVPDDRADQRRQQGVQRDQRGVDDPRCDRRGDLQRDERAGHVQHGRQRDRHPRP